MNQLRRGGALGEKTEEATIADGTRPMFACWSTKKELKRERPNGTPSQVPERVEL